MLSDKKKVAIVGVGMVGMSFAYALLNKIFAMSWY